MSATAKQLAALEKARKAKAGGKGVKKHNKRSLMGLAGLPKDLTPKFAGKDLSDAAINTGLAVVGFLSGKAATKLGNTQFLKDDLTKGKQYVMPGAVAAVGFAGATVDNKMAKSFCVGMAAAGVIDGINAAMPAGKDITDINTLKGLGGLGNTSNEQQVIPQFPSMELLNIARDNDDRRNSTNVVKKVRIAG